jgi:hypothetical protein
MLKKKEDCKDCAYCQTEERFDINKNKVLKSLFCTKVLKGQRVEQTRNKLKVSTACEYFKHKQDANKTNIRYGAIGILACTAISIYLGDPGLMEVGGLLSGGYMGLSLWSYNKEKKNAKK